MNHLRILNWVVKGWRPTELALVQQERRELVRRVLVRQVLVRQVLAGTGVVVSGPGLTLTVHCLRHHQVQLFLDCYWTYLYLPPFFIGLEINENCLDKV